LAEIEESKGSCAASGSGGALAEARSKTSEEASSSDRSGGYEMKAMRKSKIENREMSAISG